MKSLKEVISSNPLFLNDWSDKFGVMSDFENLYMSKAEYEAEAEASPYRNVEAWVERKQQADKLILKWDKINVLFASYGTGNYEGDAFVLYEQGGELFEVNGGHCSCYGLEGQFDGEKVILEELKNRLINGTFGESSYCGNSFKSELKEFLGITAD